MKRRAPREFRYNLISWTGQAITFDVPRGGVVLGLWFGFPLTAIAMVTQRPESVEGILLIDVDPDEPPEPRMFMLVPVGALAEIQTDNEIVSRGAYQLPNGKVIVVYEICKPRLSVVL